jgi:hypothetical protein
MSDDVEKKETKKEEKKSSAQKLTKALEKSSKKFGAAKQSLMKAIAHILWPVFLVILVIIIIIGIVMFLITMPGMVMEQLKALGKAIAAGMSSWFGSDDTQNVESETIYKTLDYLEDMGYDLKGYGFLTDFIEDENDLTSDEINELKDDDGNLDLTYENGVVKKNDEIVVARSDFIMAYLVSDNYTYTVKNENLVTGDGFLGKLTALGRHFVNFFGGSYGAHWTRGLISIWMEGSGGVGYRGGFYSDSGLLNFDNLDIDASAKTLKIKRSSLLNGNNAMT